jgi:proline iminopeptidase
MFGNWRFEQVDDLGSWRRGHGPNHALILHGGPGLSDYTEDLGDLLAEALPDEGAWTITRFQQRGLAPSTTQGPFTIEQHIADVLRVCDSLSADPVVLIRRARSVLATNGDK